MLFDEAACRPGVQIIERYDYDLPGNPIVLDVFGKAVFDAAGKPAQPASRFLFQSRPYYPECGLYDYRMRWYSPGLAFFVSPDSASFEAGADHYGHCGGDQMSKAPASNRYQTGKYYRVMSTNQAK